VHFKDTSIQSSYELTTHNPKYSSY